MPVPGLARRCAAPTWSKNRGQAPRLKIFGRNNVRRAAEPVPIFRPTLNSQFNFEIAVETNTQTGDILSVNIRNRKGKVAKTREYADGAAFGDYDRHGNLLAIELLGPCEAKVLDKIAAQPAAKRFVRKVVPPANACRRGVGPRGPSKRLALPLGLGRLDAAATRSFRHSVDEVADRPGHPIVDRGSREQRFEFGRVDRLGRKPRCPNLRFAQALQLTIMDRPHRLARRLRDHHAFGRGASGPILPDAGKGKRFFVAAVNEVGLLAAATPVPLPLRKSVYRDPNNAAGQNACRNDGRLPTVSARALTSRLPAGLEATGNPQHQDRFAAAVGARASDQHAASGAML